MSWYRTGTVAVTNGSKTVTGVGTLFTTAVNVGDAFALVDANLNPTGAWYEVEAVVSNTEITLKQTYAGTTGSNKQYCVFNMVGNMTTPSFAQRLATFFASFQSLIDKPTTTPTALGIPIADENGDIDSGWIPATFFNKTNILGTVSQAGGVPTGAIIERGSNANGNYVKFADGTMICYKFVSYTNLNLTVRCIKNEILPISVLSLTDSFVSVTGSCLTVPGLTTSQIGFSSLNEIAFDIYLPSGATTGLSADIYIFVIGRWC
jgi:hypothetical protein